MHAGDLCVVQLRHVTYIHLQKMYLVMELCTGGELTARLKLRGYFKEPVYYSHCGVTLATTEGAVNGLRNIVYNIHHQCCNLM